MFNEEPKHSPKNPVENGQNADCIFSPRFKSVAAMAGWEEESLLVASLVVEDTPDRESKSRKRSDSQFKTPPSNSRRKRRAQRSSPTSIPVAVLDLDEEETSRKENVKKTSEVKTALNDKEKIGANESPEQKSRVSYPSLALPCMDKLRDELSCAICLEVCFQPSTTPCGHSFCKKCLRSAADKCGIKCPKCRQLISNGRSCSVLWNTIQLLFPQDIEARKAASALNSQEAVCQNRLETAFYLAPSVIYTDSASDVWAGLEERFSQSNARRLYQIRWAISSLRQDQSSVAVYFSKLKRFWDELAYYSPLPPCNCGAMKTLHDRDQEEKVYQFLMGLHDSYAAVRGQILLMNPLPPLNGSYALVLLEEKQREITNSLHSSDGMAFTMNRSFSGSHYASDSNENGRGCGKGKYRKCNHYRKLRLPGFGHSIDRCYRLHGYPPGHRLHKSNDDTSTNSVLGAKPSSRNANQDDSTPAARFFTPAQYEQILALLNEGTPRSLSNLAGACNEEDDWVW